MFSSGVHFLGLAFVFLFSSISLPTHKKQNKVFYVDFVGASTVTNAGAKGGGNGEKSSEKDVKNDKNDVKKLENDKKSAEKDALKIPQQKQDSKTNQKTEKKSQKKDSAKTVASKKTAKQQKKADKADYLEAEDFSGELPPPSMAAAKSFLPEKSSSSGSGRSGGSGGEVSEGIGGGGFRTDTDFPYPWYISQVREALFNAWAANSPSVSGLQCTAAFTILRNGGIKNAKIEKSSGNRLFDSAALSAVRASLPFDRLPDDFYEDVLVIHVEFRSTD